MPLIRTAHVYWSYLIFKWLDFFFDFGRVSLEYHCYWWNFMFLQTIGMFYYHHCYCIFLLQVPSAAAVKRDGQGLMRCELCNYKTAVSLVFPIFPATISPIGVFCLHCSHLFWLSVMLFYDFSSCRSLINLLCFYYLYVTMTHYILCYVLHYIIYVSNWPSYILYIIFMSHWPSYILYLQWHTNLKRHYATHEPKVCSYCSYETMNRTHFIKHMKSHEANNSDSDGEISSLNNQPEEYTCGVPTCGFSTTSPKVIYLVWLFVSNLNSC